MTLSYILLFILLLLIGWRYESSSCRNKYIYDCVCVVVLVLFFGLRGEVGDDWGAYKEFYDQRSWAGKFGLGFSFVNLLSSSLSLPFQFVIFACTGVTNLLLYRFANKNTLNVPLFFALFLAFDGLVNEMNFIRNTIGIVIFLNTIEYIEQRDIRRYMLFNLVGTLFHYSSFIYLPFYWLLGKRLSVKTYSIILLTAFCLFFFHLPLLAIFTTDSGPILDIPHFGEYIYNNLSIRPLQFTYGYIEHLLTGIAICILYENITTVFLHRVAVNAFLIYCLCYCLFSHYAIIATRLANLFVFSHWLLWPPILLSISARRVRAVVSVWLLISMLLRLLSISLMSQWEYKLFI